MQRYVLHCKRTTCSARLPTLLGRCSVRASCVVRAYVPVECPHLSLECVVVNANVCTRERALLLARRAKRRACECVRVLSHGGEQHATVSRPGVANHRRHYTLPFHRRYRLSRRALLAQLAPATRESRLFYALRV